MKITLEGTLATILLLTIIGLLICIGVNARTFMEASQESIVEMKANETITEMERISTINIFTNIIGIYALLFCTTFIAFFLALTWLTLEEIHDTLKKKGVKE